MNITTCPDKTCCCEPHTPINGDPCECDPCHAMRRIIEHAAQCDVCSGKHTTLSGCHTGKALISKYDRLVLR